MEKSRRGGFILSLMEIKQKALRNENEVLWHTSNIQPSIERSIKLSKQQDHQRNEVVDKKGLAELILAQLLV